MAKILTPYHTYIHRNGFSRQNQQGISNSDIISWHFNTNRIRNKHTVWRGVTLWRSDHETWLGGYQWLQKNIQSQSNKTSSNQFYMIVTYILVSLFAHVTWHSFLSVKAWWIIYRVHFKQFKSYLTDGNLSFQYSWSKVNQHQTKGRFFAKQF